VFFPWRSPPSAGWIRGFSAPKQSPRPAQRPLRKPLAGRTPMMKRKVMDTTKVFSTKAEKYAKFRWDYAADGIETVVNLTQISVHSIVADIGAGTGILTKHFIGKAQEIYAIEPNFELRQILTRELGAFPSVSVIDSCAEATKLPDNCVDVITVAQAIHWFDPEPTRQEMMRILKVHGWLVLIRNYGADNEANKAIQSLMTEEYGANFSVVTEQPKVKPSSFYFGNGDFQTFSFPFAFRQGWEEFIGTLTTVSFMPDEDHPIFPKLETEAKRIFSQYSSNGYWKVEGETELIIGRPSKWTSNRKPLVHSEKFTEGEYVY
jgi:ubiquinone/menaquinone biosynthesis C-methylase UbiE